jgi:hypothetical protein
VSAAELAAAVKTRRADLGLTQAHVADAGGPSTETLRLIEGEHLERYTHSTTRRLDKALGWIPGTARRLLVDPATPERCPRCADLEAELANVRAELALERARRTLGGTPPGYYAPGTWTNQRLPPPASATDPNAPPLVTHLSSRPADDLDADRYRWGHR